MNSRPEFTQFLWESLKESSYVWLNPAACLVNDDVVPEILIASKSVQNLLTRMRQTPNIGACRASFRFQNTFAVFSFGEWDYAINFVHHMVSKNLYFIESEQVLEKRVKNNRGVYIPCIEHLMEYTVLKSFLNRKGIQDKEYQFFKDFHILVQEDLVEFFNDKYATSFGRIYDFTSYNAKAKQAIIARLKGMPLNRLTKVMNIRWHNFIGRVRKEARMI